MRSRFGLRAGRQCRAFTLIELMAALVTVSALMAIAIPRFQVLLQQARIVQAISQIHILQTEIDDQEALPASLDAINRQGYADPWGNAYVYYPFPPTHGNAPPAGARRDRFLVPVNTKYDLYSMGPDGKTAIAFTAAAARDDIVRASDGAYVGVASKF